MNISIFLPVRAGSERISNKNTRAFHPNGQSLFEYKLTQIEKIKDRFFEIIISTNDQEIINQIPENFIDSRVRLVIRPDDLCCTKTKVQDLIRHAADETRGDVVFWLHVTSPFVDEKDYSLAIKQYQNVIDTKTGDSLISANKIQQFIWSEKEKRIVNAHNNTNYWVNTQDLEPLYEINHAFYINSRKNYHEINDRIGRHPALFPCEGLKKIDIDWYNDFVIAQQLIPLYESDGLQPKNRYSNPSPV